MSRRKFLKKAAWAGAALTFPSGLNLLYQNALASDTPDLAVVKGKTPSLITQKAIEILGGITKFINKHDVVVVKPNMAWDRLPGLAGNTNPDVVASVVKLCFEAGAKKVKVFDRPVNDPRRCYVQSGIAAAARSMGAEVSHIDERKFKKMNINGKVLKKWPLYTEVFEADKIINIPIAKHHSLAKLTMAMKNWMGIMGGNRSKIHQQLGESLTDLSLFIKPTLTVLDAVRILVRNGPQGGNPGDVKMVNTVVAGVDQVAIDSFGATFFNKQGKDLEYVLAGHRRGLGTMNLDALNIHSITI